MNKIQVLKTLKDLKKKIYNSPKTLKDIATFESTISPSLCKSCQTKLNRIRGGNILNTAAKGNYFCKECNDIIIQKATEIFTRI